MSATRTRCSWPAERLALAALLALAAALRLPGLGELPPGLHPDEAANAADALRGAWALCYAHEGGWVEGTYVWLAAPCLALAGPLGASLEAAVRLPAALAGLALVPAVVLLGRRLAGDSAGWLAGLLVAVAPWAVHHARLGLRAALIAPLAAWGLVLLLRAEERAGTSSDRQALLAGALFAAAAATYPPARLVLPLLLLSWWLLARRRALLLAGLSPLLALLLLLPWTLGQDGGQRLRDVLAVGQGQGPLHDLAAAARGWGLHFGPRFLWSGASSRGFAPEGVGLLPRVTAPLLALGLLALCLRRDGWRARLLLWLALAPLPAALTLDVPNALRAGLLLPALALLVALAAQALLRAAPPRSRRALRALLAGLLLAQGLSAFARYARVHAVAEARFYDAGRREAVQAADPLARERLLLCRDPFLGAWLRLHAPGLPAARSPDGAWILGPGAGEPGREPEGELLLLQVGVPPLEAQGSEHVLVPGRAWLRPR